MSLRAVESQQVRLSLTHWIARLVQQVLGADLLAVAVYGSVALGEAWARSDLEMVALTADGVPPK